MIGGAQTELIFDKNYASAECAKVVEANPEAKKPFLIINDSKDEYMLNPCQAKIWFVIELCETIQATHIKIANCELFSSTPKDFTVYFSDVYPAVDWKIVGNFTAADKRELQTFDLNRLGFGKYIRVELHSHYGKEHYCPISQVKIYGVSMVDEYENHKKNHTKSKTKLRWRISAYRVYKNMLSNTEFCSLSKPHTTNDTRVIVPNPIQEKKPEKPNNPSFPIAPLKPSIYVELNNKYNELLAALNILRYQNEQMARRLNETETRLQRSTSFLSNNFQFLVIIVKAFLVFKLMLYLL